MFERPIEARLMAIDGTWQRPCKIHDVSELSAKLVIDGAINDIGQRVFPGAVPYGAIAIANSPGLTGSLSVFSS